MKIGIVSDIDNFDKVIKGNNYNYVKFIAEHFSKKHKVRLFNWRDVDKNIHANKYLFKHGSNFIEGSNFDLNECDILFVKQLGKIHKEPKRFMSFLDYLDKFNGKILNSTETIKRNLSKDYLFKLQQEGFPVIPTIKHDSSLNLDETKSIQMDLKGLEGLVIKPLSFGEQGQGVRLVNLFSNNLEFENYKNYKGDLICQPVIPEIFTSGEYSLVFLGKKFSHGIHKHNGDFKITFSEKSVYEEYIPKGYEIDIATSILDSWKQEVGYSRIDFIKHRGKPLISEVEMVNPSFYIENLPGVGERFIKNFEYFLEGGK